MFNHVLNMFWGDFFENVFCPVFHGGSGLRKFSKKSKKFKISKKPEIVSKSVHTCFEHALGRFFRLFLPSVRCRAFQIFWTWKMWVQFSGLKFWGRDLEKIKGKNQKSFKVLKLSKNASKCPNVFWGRFFWKCFFCRVFHGVIESIWKNQRHFKIAEMPKIFAKIVQLVLNMFCGNFLD